MNRKHSNKAQKHKPRYRQPKVSTLGKLGVVRGINGRARDHGPRPYFR
jgi:hypothetical protein